MRGYETHSDPAYESKYSAFRVNSAPARPAAAVGPAVREVSAPVFRVRIIGVALGQVPPGEGAQPPHTDTVGAPPQSPKRPDAKPGPSSAMPET